MEVLKPVIWCTIWLYQANVCIKHVHIYLSYFSFLFSTWISLYWIRCFNESGIMCCYRIGRLLPTVSEEASSTVQAAGTVTAASETHATDRPLTQSLTQVTSDVVTITQLVTYWNRLCSQYITKMTVCGGTLRQTGLPQHLTFGRGCLHYHRHPGVHSSWTQRQRHAGNTPVTRRTLGGEWHMLMTVMHGKARAITWWHS